MREIVRFEASNIEKELVFAAWVRSNGILKVLIDMDDTLCRTRDIFVQHERQFVEYVAASVPTRTKEEWKDIFVATNNHLFERVGVNPNRWNLLVDVMLPRKKVGKDIRNNALEIVMNIYQTPPKFIDGTEDGLAFLNATRVDFGIVTHANTPWTRRKYNWLGLERFLDWDEVYIVDENRHKDEQAWLDAIRYLGGRKLRPRQCLVMGDSPRTDINPTTKVGVENCVLIQARNNGLWSIHNQPVGDKVWLGDSVDNLQFIARS